MNTAHLHLLVNHFPIIIPIIALFVLIAALIKKSHTLQNTSFILFAIAALFTIVAMSSGDGAEEVVENIQGVNENNIEAHEHSAETFAIFSYILAVISLVALWANITAKSFNKILHYVVVIFSIITLFFAQKTGSTGGEIRHTEITNGGPSMQNGNSLENNNNESGENEGTGKEETEENEKED